MALIKITEKQTENNNLLYIQSSISELLSQTDSKVNVTDSENRETLNINCDDRYIDIIKAELTDKISEVIAIKYKYDFFKKNVILSGLNDFEREIMLASLIAADLEEDKRYIFNKIFSDDDIAIDGIYNFKLKLLKQKWDEIVSYVPTCFMNSQLKDFVTFLLENKKKRVYIEGENVYDNHYRKLKRSCLLDGEKGKIIREVLLSNCGEVELNGKLPEDDEFYLKEFFNDKIIFSKKFFD